MVYIFPIVHRQLGRCDTEGNAVQRLSPTRVLAALEQLFLLHSVSVIDILFVQNFSLRFAQRFRHWHGK